MINKVDRTGEGKVNKHNQAIQHFQGYEILYHVNSDPLFHPVHIKK